MTGGVRSSVPSKGAVIDNPILNPPYAEPTRHFRFDDTGITDEIVEGRRPSFSATGAGYMILVSLDRVAR